MKPITDEKIRKVQRYLDGRKPGGKRFTQAEIQRICRVSNDTVRRIKKGEIVPGRVPRKGKIDLAKLDEFLAQVPPPLVQEMADHFEVSHSAMSRAITKRREHYDSVRRRNS